MTFSKHNPRKRFGQHWLKDSTVLRKIVHAAELNSEDRVLEIGPGRGALTEQLLASAACSVHSIEIDTDLVVGLRKRFVEDSRFSVQVGDVLKVPLRAPNGLYATKVVANIPYNITGPLLERLMGKLGHPPSSNYRLLVLLLQKEVAQRIRACPGDKSFSALSVRIQLMARCRAVCSVSSNCFEPPPKVMSEVLAIEPFSFEQQLDHDLGRRVNSLVRQAFSSRRKMLRNTLGKSYPLHQLEVIAEDVGIGLDQRPQEISPLSWLQLAKRCNEYQLNGNE